MIILTGVSRGLGQELFNQLLFTSIPLVGISRNFTPEQQEQYKHDSNRITLIQADLSKIEEIEDCINHLEIDLNHEEELFIILNAGVIEPIGKVGELDHLDIMNSSMVNYISPAILTNMLVARYRSMCKKITVLNISSGAALKAIEGWSMYCSSKAALRMYLDVLEQENKADGRISVSHLDPGVMNTDMQNKIRAADFPSNSYFVKLKDEDKLNDPADVAAYIIKEYIQP